MKGSNTILKYETVLEMLDDGPVPYDEILENLEEKYNKSHISDVLFRMNEKGYVAINGEKIEKKKELYFNAIASE